MEKAPKKDMSFYTIKGKIITVFRNNSSIMDDCALINIKRIYYLSLILAPMRILDIYFFSDTISRFGGEEFIILAPRTSLEKGFALAEKLRKSIASNIFVTDSAVLHITASFGVSLLQTTGDHGFEKYFLPADKALYLAKKRGKNRVEKILHEQKQIN